MYRTHLILHISIFFLFLFHRLGMYGECVSFGLPLPRRGIMGSGIHRKWEILSSCERHKASECEELVLKKKDIRSFLLGTCQRILVSFYFHPRSANLCTIPSNSKYICAVSMWIVLPCLLYILYNVLGGGCRGKGACCAAYPAATVTAAQTRGIKNRLMEVLTCVSMPWLLFLSLPHYSTAATVFTMYMHTKSSQIKTNSNLKTWC